MCSALVRTWPAMLVTIGTCGSRSGEWSMISASRVGGLLHQRRMRGDADAQRHDRARAGLADQLDGPIERGSLAGDDELLGRVRVGHADDAAGFARGALAGALELGAVETVDRGHAARTMVAGLLHQPAALADQPQRVAEVQRAGGDQRGVLAQAVASDEARRLPVLTDGLELFAHRGQAGQRHGQNGRLGVDRVFELVGRALEAQLRQLEAEDLVGLLEDAPRGARGLVQRFAHADVLRPLAGEHER